MVTTGLRSLVIGPLGFRPGTRRMNMGMSMKELLKLRPELGRARSKRRVKSHARRRVEELAAARAESPEPEAPEKPPRKDEDSGEEE